MADTSARFLTRRARLDKERALGTARNPGDSKYGNALYKNNAQENRLYSAELNRIEKQLKRTSMHIDQEKKQFLQKHSQRDPMLIVVRPPSPLMLKKHKELQYESDAADYHSYSNPGTRPRYMKPTKSRAKTANLRPTIDAFSLKTKKKVNVWEEVLLEKEKPNFKSTVMPSWPLTSSEVDDLILGMETHKQVAGGGGTNLYGQPTSLVHYEPEVSHVQKKKKKPPVSKDKPEAKDADWHFVTDLRLTSPKSDTTTTLTNPASETESFESNRHSECEFEAHANKTKKRTDLRKPKKAKPKNKVKLEDPEMKQMERNNQTAICVVHNDEPPKTNVVVVPSPDRPTSPTSSSDSDENEHSELETQSTNQDQKSTEENDLSVAERATHKKHRSGLEVILEAAIEGID